MIHTGHKVAMFAVIVDMSSPPPGIPRNMFLTITNNMTIDHQCRGEFFFMF